MLAIRGIGKAANHLFQISQIYYHLLTRYHLC